MKKNKDDKKQLHITRILVMNICEGPMIWLKYKKICHPFKTKLLGDRFPKVSCLFRKFHHTRVKIGVCTSSVQMPSTTLLHKPLHKAFHCKASFQTHPDHAQPTNEWRHRSFTWCRFMFLLTSCIYRHLFLLSCIKSINRWRLCILSCTYMYLTTYI